MPTSELPHEGVLTRLEASKLHGVGVFAIMAIAEDTELFVHDQAEIHWIEADAIDGLNEARQALYRDFAIRCDGRLGCPRSFDLLTPGWYLNQPAEGDHANVRARDDYRFVAVRFIQPGEELTLDYSTFSRGPVGR